LNWAGRQSHEIDESAKPEKGPESTDTTGIRVTVHQAGLDQVLAMLLDMAFADGYWKRMIDIFVPADYDRTDIINSPFGNLSLEITRLNIQRADRPRSVGVRLDAERGINVTASGLEFELTLLLSLEARGVDLFRTRKNRLNNPDYHNIKLVGHDVDFTATFVPRIEHGEFTLDCSHAAIALPRSIHLTTKIPPPIGSAVDIAIRDYFRGSLATLIASLIRNQTKEG
jgi:hypothetical protein